MFLLVCRSLVRAHVSVSARVFTRPRASIMSSGAQSGFATQDFHYFLVLDFEATCIKNSKPSPQEIIEFPVLKVSGKSFEVESVFHTYVQPQVHGISDFCTELTGITSSMVDGQPTLDQTLQMFHEWMEEENLLQPNVKSVFVTCGDWDLKTMLPGQCTHFKWPKPQYFNQWINIKKAFARVTGVYPNGLIPMLQHLNIEPQGRLHSGIDDCKNIATILKALAERRYRFTATGACR